MATRTAPATKTIDPFAGLLETAEVTEKRTTVDRKDIQVPQEWMDRVESAFINSERVTLKITDKNTYDTVSNLLRAAGDKSEKNITVTCKAVYDGEGDDAKLTGLSFTVGNRRGSKPKAKVPSVDSDAK